MPEATGKRVLIVEDDPDAADALKILLEDEGFATTLAADAQAALDRVHAEKPDVVLLDVMMPAGTEGFHFVWELRKDPDARLRELPIIVLTAIQGKTGLKFRPEEGDSSYGPYEYLPVQGFLDKTASSAELIATINKALAGG